MPDLQTELSKVINQWSEPEMPAQPDPKPRGFTPTTGTSRATAEYILANPGASRKSIVDAMTTQGHNRMTVYSLLVQMKRQGLVTPDGEHFTANYSEYTPVKSYASWKNSVTRGPGKRKYTRDPGKAAARAAAKAAAYEAHENYNPTAQPQVVAPPEFNAEEFVNGLTLKQAKAVYGELKKVFE